MDTKICSKCKIEKNISEFYARKGSCSGLRADCKMCCSVRNAAWHAAHPGQHNATAAIWRKTNHTKHVAAASAWNKKNPEKHRTSVRKWEKAHPGKTTAYCAKWAAANLEERRAINREWYYAHTNKVSAAYRKWRISHANYVNARVAAREARKLQATPAWADFGYIDAAYTMSAAMTQLTGVKYHVDHIVPLRSKLVCGLHNQFNLQLLPASENTSKGNRYWPDMPDLQTSQHT